MNFKKEQKDATGEKEDKEEKKDPKEEKEKDFKEEEKEKFKRLRAFVDLSKSDDESNGEEDIEADVDDEIPLKKRRLEPNLREHDDEISKMKERILFLEEQKKCIKDMAVAFRAWVKMYQKEVVIYCLDEMRVNLTQ